MPKKNIENILLIILVFLFIVQQSLFTFFDLHIYDKLSKLILIKNKYIEFVIVTIIFCIILIKRKQVDKTFVSGRCEFPITLLKNDIPKNSNVKLTIENIHANRIIVYWTVDSLDKYSEDYNLSENPELTNAGVAKTDNNGSVDLYFRKTKQNDEPHVFLRIEETPGIFGGVHKLFYGKTVKN